MDAITLLKNDHKTVEKLFKQFKKAGKNAHVEKRAIVDRIVEELSIHAAIEEQCLYPVARRTVPETEDDALESLEEHHIVKWLLSELDDMDPRDERFDAKVTVLIEVVRHHVEEEEEDFFPQLRDKLGRKSLGEIGDALERAKATAPTKPHPRAPDTPPGNLVAGAGAGAADRVEDMISGIAQGAVSAAQDLMALVMGSKRPTPQPTGSTVAKKTARQVRRSATTPAKKAVATTRRARKVGGTTAKSAARGARKTATAAKSATTSTGRAAKKSARATAGTAKKSAKRTASTAKKSAKRTASTAKRSAAATKR